MEGCITNVESKRLGREPDEVIAVQGSQNKDAGIPHWQRTSQALIYHRRAQNNEFLLRTVPGTSFLIIRASILGPCIELGWLKVLVPQIYIHRIFLRGLSTPQLAGSKAY